MLTRAGILRAVRAGVCGSASFRYFGNASSCIYASARVAVVRSAGGFGSHNALHALHPVMK